MNVEFAISVSKTEAIKRLRQYVDCNPITTGVFTIGDEQVRFQTQGKMSIY